MTLKDAIEAAFGRTAVVRRKSWPPGSYASIKIPTDSRDPLWGPVFERRMPANQNPNADDWEPCTRKGDPPSDDWSQVLATQQNARNSRCTVCLDGCVLNADDCTILWIVPEDLWLRVGRHDDCFDEWPPEGHAGARRLSIRTTAETVQVFSLLRVKVTRAEQGTRVFRLTVVRDEQESK